MPTLIEDLYALQTEHGYLREEDLRDLSKRIKVPLYEIEGVSSFYPHFRRTPPPRAHVTACRDLTCRMNGGASACAQLRQLCDGSADVEFHEVSCLGRCDSAPAATVNDVPVAPHEVAGYLDDLSTLPPHEPTATPRDWKADEGDRYGMLERMRAGGNVDAMIETIKNSGLKGMGGAGFPTGLKWQFVRAEQATPKYVICNADESEPGTFKDREHARTSVPHLGSSRAWRWRPTGHRGGEAASVFIRHEYGKPSAIGDPKRAHRGGRATPSGLGRRPLRGRISPSTWRSSCRPVATSSARRRRSSRRMEDKPRRAAQQAPLPGERRGSDGLPTLINNVETFAMVPYVLRNRKQDVKFFSVSGDVSRPDVYEVPVGTTLRQLVEIAGGMADDKELLAFLPGGASTSFLPADQADVEMDWTPLANAGSSLGSGAVVIVGEGRDMYELARNVTAFFRNESCGKCVPCRVGTEKAVTIIDNNSGMELMPELHETLLETSICGLGQAALNPILSVLKHWPR